MLRRPLPLTPRLFLPPSLPRKSLMQLFRSKAKSYILPQQARLPARIPARQVRRRLNTPSGRHSNRGMTAGRADLAVIAAATAVGVAGAIAALGDARAEAEDAIADRAATCRRPSTLRRNRLTPSRANPSRLRRSPPISNRSFCRGNRSRSTKIARPLHRPRLRRKVDWPKLPRRKAIRRSFRKDPFTRNLPPACRIRSTPLHQLLFLRVARKPSTLPRNRRKFI